MPSSSRIIRGSEAAAYQSWNAQLLGTDYDSPVDRLLTEISRTHGTTLVHKALASSQEPEPTAEELRLAAREQALNEREAQIAQLEQQAIERGQQQGLQQGYDAGWDAANQERLLIAQAAAQLHDEFEQYKAGLADQLLSLAIAVSKKVLADSLQANPQHAKMLLEQVLDSHQIKTESLILLAHPRTLAALQAQVDQAHHLGGVRLVEDVSQLPGGLVLRHSEGEVDASLQTRWARALEALGQESPLTPQDLGEG